MEPIQPEAEYVIAALQEELQAAHANRIYLLAVLKKTVTEFAQARELWGLERASIIADRDEKTEP